MKPLWFVLLLTGYSTFAQQAEKSTPIQETEKTQTISLSEYGINGSMEVPIVEGYEPIFTKIGTKKQKKVRISIGPGFRMTIAAIPTTYSDAEIYLDIYKKVAIKMWFENNPAGPQPTMIINEPNGYLMQREKEFKLAYVVTIDKMRYEFEPAGYVFELEDGLRYIRAAKSFFPK